MKNSSLRIDLIKSLAGPLVVSIVVMILGATAATYHEVQEVYDVTLSQYARILSETVPEESGGANNQMGAAHPSYERKVSFRIFDGDKLLMQSFNASDAPPEAIPVGFTNQEIAGKSWRMYVREDGSGRRVEVAERWAHRHEIVFQLLLSLVLPALCFTGLTIVLFWRGITIGLKRLTKLSDQVDAREAHDLTPIGDSQVPREVGALVDALNRLFDRLAESFNRERQFTDNAAHELRTPLAAIKTQAQVIARTEKLSATGQDQLENLLQATDRATAMTQSLLTFSRLENEKASFAPVNVANVVAEEIDGLRLSAEKKSISLVAELDQHTVAEGVKDALAILVRNLVQNAIRYTPTGGQVVVVLKAQNNGLNFEVRDTGPGIADEYKQRVFERFYRINKAEASGAGLGLAMAAWVARLHGTEVELADVAPTGLSARIHLPLKRPV